MLRAAVILGLAGLCLAAADTSPDLVLARLRQRVAADLPRMTNFTCVETVTRRSFKPDANHALQSWSSDRLRLDVAMTAVREIYSWAGARQFEDRDLTDIIGGGPIGTGAFGAFLSSIFDSGDAEFTYAGESQGWMEFAYRIPADKSHYQVRAGKGWVITGYEGRVLIHSETGDLLRLSIRADNLPESTGSHRTETEIEYDGSLLPRTTRQRFVLRTGLENENTATFSACREYRGESTLRFPQEVAALSAGSDTTSSRQSKLAALPPDLPVTMRLAAPLDTWNASGGDVIALRLTKPILNSARHVVAPAGAAIEARLIRVQRFFTKPERVTVVIQPSANVPPGQFDFVGDHVILPKGYHTTWRTAPGPVISNP
jgi:hypothetical protein